jgi:hypothetical protein
MMAMQKCQAILREKLSCGSYGAREESTPARTTELEEARDVIRKVYVGVRRTRQYKEHIMKFAKADLDVLSRCALVRAHLSSSI